MNRLRGIIKLSRYKELTFSLVLSTIAAFYSNVDFTTIKFFSIVFATYLSVMFAFMINDVEDADDDKLDEKKSKRNPISAGQLTKFEGYFITWSTAVISALLFLAFGNIASLLLNLIALSLGFLYSWKSVRLKNRAFFDTFSHSLFLGGLVFLAPFIAFDQFRMVALIPFFTGLSFAADGSLYNQIRDFKVDREVGLQNTVSVIGINTATFIAKFFKFGSIAGVILIGISTLDRYYEPFAIPAILVIIAVLGYLVLIKKKSTHATEVNHLLLWMLTIFFTVSVFLR